MLGNLVLTVITLCAILSALSLTAVARTNLRSALQQTPGAPQCDVKGDTEISITCDYSPAPNGAAQIAGPPIAVNHASFIFDTDQDSRMKIGLTITNRGPDAIAEARIVYVAIDGADGNNYLRRPLPHVDLSKIAPEQTIAYSETLLSPAFPRGTYTIHLWIPSSESSLKFDPAHNLLFNNIRCRRFGDGIEHLGDFHCACVVRSQKISALRIPVRKSVSFSALTHSSTFRRRFAYRGPAFGGLWIDTETKAAIVLTTIGCAVPPAPPVD